MEEENQTISIQGKKINYSKLSDEKLTQLYQELKQREVILYERILKKLSNLNYLANKNNLLKQIKWRKT